MIKFTLVHDPLFFISNIHLIISCFINFLMIFSNQKDKFNQFLHWNKIVYTISFLIIESNISKLLKTLLPWLSSISELFNRPRWSFFFITRQRVEPNVTSLDLIKKYHISLIILPKNNRKQRILLFVNDFEYFFSFCYSIQTYYWTYKFLMVHLIPIRKNLENCYWKKLFWYLRFEY